MASAWLWGDDWRMVRLAPAQPTRDERLLADTRVPHHHPAGLPLIDPATPIFLYFQVIGQDLVEMFLRFSAVYSS